MPDSPSHPLICPLSPFLSASAFLTSILPSWWPGSGEGGCWVPSPPPLLPTGNSSAASELGEWRLEFKAPQDLAPNFLSKPFSHPASNIPFPLATLDSSYEKRKEKPLGLECKTTLKKIHVSLKFVILFFFLTTVSWNDFSALSSFYLPNLFTPPPPVVSTWLSWPSHLAKRARDIYVYSELLQLLIFPLIWLLSFSALYYTLLFIYIFALNSLKEKVNSHPLPHSFIHSFHWMFNMPHLFLGCDDIKTKKIGVCLSWVQLSLKN